MDETGYGVMGWHDELEGLLLLHWRMGNRTKQEALPIFLDRVEGLVKITNQKFKCIIFIILYLSFSRCVQ